MSESIPSQDTLRRLIVSSGEVVGRSWSATCRGLSYGLLASTGVVAHWHERLSPKQRDPELYEHVGIRNEARKFADRLSRLGYGHRQCRELILAGSVVLLALGRSMPVTICSEERVSTDAVSKRLAAELRRLAFEPELLGLAAASPSAPEA